MNTTPDNLKDDMTATHESEDLGRRGGVFVLGNFDGVHCGHQAVIKSALHKGQQMNLPVRVLTFEPHPRTLFRPKALPFRLTPAPVKARLLRALGVDGVITLAFTPAFAQQTAQEFIHETLVRAYGVRHVVAGFDFVFGHERTGTMQDLREGLALYNVDVTEVAPFSDRYGETLSSSRTREALRRGDLDTAQHILGRPWFIAGHVQHGSQRARQLGFPTANVGLGDYLRPLFGAYAIMARRVGSDISFPGVANIGTRPTVDGHHEWLEFHLFDFHEEIYGQEWEVDLLHFLRAERAFPGLPELREQITGDVEKAKTYLSGMGTA